MNLSPTQLSEKYEIPLETSELAVMNLSLGSAKFIAVSGKIGSGKDTVAPLVLNQLTIPTEERIHEFFAKPLKIEVNSACDILRESSNAESSALEISKTLNVPYPKALEVANAIFEEISTGTSKDAYNRTPSMRKVLQFWGTEIRREQDENYWVKKALKSALEKIAHGYSVYVTDARFPNEVDAVRDAGGSTVRLLISDKEQSRRIFARDGIEMSDSARNHASETSLDNYTGFDVTVDTDVSGIQEVAQIISNNIRKRK